MSRLRYLFFVAKRCIKKRPVWELFSFFVVEHNNIIFLVIFNLSICSHTYLFSTPERKLPKSNESQFQCSSMHNKFGTREKADYPVLIMTSSFSGGYL